jgi:ABC-type branched-subunit amino acid transport system permease subunit
LIVYGLILVIIVGFLPNGLIGLFKRKAKKARGAKNA